MVQITFRIHFLGLMMDGVESKHVAISQKQGYHFYNKYICVYSSNYHRINKKAKATFRSRMRQIPCSYHTCFLMLLDAQRYTENLTLTFFLQLRNGWTCRVVSTVVPHTKVCEYSFYKTLLMMDR